MRRKGLVFAVLISDLQVSPDGFPPEIAQTLTGAAPETSHRGGAAVATVAPFALAWDGEGGRSFALSLSFSFSSHAAAAATIVQTSAVSAVA